MSVGIGANAGGVPLLSVSEVGSESLEHETRIDSMASRLKYWENFMVNLRFGY